LYADAAVYIRKPDAADSTVLKISDHTTAEQQLHMEAHGVKTGVSIKRVTYACIVIESWNGTLLATQLLQLIVILQFTQFAL
jgi:hypothetical protein